MNQKNLPPNPKDAYGLLKPNLALVPAAALIHTALAMQEGARKYGAFNWRNNSVEAATYFSACLRHLLSWYDREDLDPESGAKHLGHAAACIGILLDAEHCGNLIDNRPPESPTGQAIRAHTRMVPKEIE